MTHTTAAEVEALRARYRAMLDGDAQSIYVSPRDLLVALDAIAKTLRGYEAERDARKEPGHQP